MATSWTLTSNDHGSETIIHHQDPDLGAALPPEILSTIINSTLEEDFDDAFDSGHPDNDHRKWHHYRESVVTLASVNSFFLNEAVTALNKSIEGGMARMPTTQDEHGDIQLVLAVNDHRLKLKWLAVQRLHYLQIKLKDSKWFWALDRMPLELLKAIPDIAFDHVDNIDMTALKALEVYDKRIRMEMEGRWELTEPVVQPDAGVNSGAVVARRRRRITAPAQWKVTALAAAVFALIIVALPEGLVHLVMTIIVNG